MSQDSHTQSPVSQIGDMLDDGLILTNLDGVVVSANPAAVRWFGENLTGQKIFDVINHPNIGDLFAKAVDGAKGSETYYELTNITFGESLTGQRIFDVINPPNIGEFLVKVADGAKGSETHYKPTNTIEREFQMRLKRFGDHSVALLFLDMTLQRNLEKVRSDFVANVSHELRSPLTSLAGFVETMLSDEVPDPAMRMRFLTIMDEEAKRMSRLIDDLLSLSRVEVDEHIIPDNRVNLAELLHSVGDSMSGRAMKKNMNIKITQPDDAQSHAALPVIFGKHDEITEVFVNLLENAIKYGFDKKPSVGQFRQRSALYRALCAGFRSRRRRACPVATSCAEFADRCGGSGDGGGYAHSIAFSRSARAVTRARCAGRCGYADGACGI